MKGLKNLLVGVVVLILANLFDRHTFKEERMKNKGLWFLVIALLGVVLGLLGCAKYQPYTSVLPVAFPPQLNDLAAMTECEYGGQPIILVNSNVQMTHQTLKYLLVHERQHAVDMRIHGCRKAVARVQHDKDFLMMLEIRAYCAQFMAMLNDGVLIQPAWQYRSWFENVWIQYGQHLPREVFFRRITCRIPP